MRLLAARVVMVVGVAVALLGYGAGSAWASWNGQLYHPGATLDPECDPGAINCDVQPPANSGNNTNITQLSGLTVPLDTTQGGTGLNSSVTAGALLVGNGSAALDLVPAGANGQILGYGSGGPQWITPAGGTAYTAGGGLSLSGTAFSVDEAAAHTWTALQEFDGGLQVGGASYTDLAGAGLAVSSGVLELDVSGLPTNTTTTGADRVVVYDSTTGDTVTVSKSDFLAGQQNLSLASSGSSSTTSSNSGLELTGSQLALLRGCGSGQLLKWNGSAWACADDVDTDTDTDTDTNTTYTAGTGLSLSGTTFGVNTAASLTYTGVPTYQNGVTVGGDTVTDLTGAGLSVNAGALRLDPSGLGTTNSFGTGDQLLLYNTNTQTVVRIAASDLLAGVTGSLNYKGTWNAGTNTPSLTSACTAGAKGAYYVVAVAGSTTLDGYGPWTVGDWAVCNGATWQRVQTAAPADAVSSVFGRTGAVTAAGGDYTATQITNQPAGSVASTTVQAAINELAGEKYGAGDNATLGTLAAGATSVDSLSAGATTLGATTATSLGVSTGADRHTVVASFASTDGSSALYVSNGSPEGDLSAARGALAVDSANGKLYIKTTAGGATGWSEFGAASVCNTNGCNFTGGGPYAVTAGTTNGAMTISSNGSGALTLDSTGSGAVNLGTGSSAKTVTVGNTTGATAVVVNAGSGKFTVNGASVLGGDVAVGSNKLTIAAGDGSVALTNGKFSLDGTTGNVSIAGTATVTGAASLNGGASVSGALSVGGTEVHPATAIANLPTGGAIGAAPATVDAHSYFTVAQTTAGQTVTLPSPTTATAGQVVYVSNTGSASFGLYGLTVGAGQSAALVWDGSAWTATGSQSAPVCTTTGCTFGGSATVQTQTGGALSVVTDTTGALTLDSGSTGPVNLGTGSSAKTVTIGNGTGATGVVLTAGTGGLSASTTATTTTGNSFAANAVSSGTALGLSANGLTSGNGLAVTSSSTSMSGSLGYIALTGNNANNTGNLLYLNSSGVSSTATGLKITIAGSGLAELIDGAVAWKSTAYTSTGTQNDVAFSKSTSTVRLNPASALTITGIAAGSDGQLLTMWNASSTTVTLADANAGSVAANRLSTGSGVNVSLAAGTTAILQYDGSSSVWRIVSRPATAPSVLLATTSAAQTTGINNNDPIKFNTVTYSSGADITLTAATFTFNLKANHPYMLNGQFNTANFSLLNTNAYVNAAWYDTTGTATQIGQSCTTLSTTVSLLASGGSPVCMAVFAPTVDSTVQLRITGVSGLNQLGSSGALPTAILQELSGAQ